MHIKITALFPFRLMTLNHSLRHFLWILTVKQKTKYRNWDRGGETNAHDSESTPPASTSCFTTSSFYCQILHARTPIYHQSCPEKDKNCRKAHFPLKPNFLLASKTWTLSDCCTVFLLCAPGKKLPNAVGWLCSTWCIQGLLVNYHIYLRHIISTSRTFCCS